MHYHRGGHHRAAVNDIFVPPTVDAIIRGARSGTIGDGKIFILPVENTIRVRTGEEGDNAVNKNMIKTRKEVKTI